MRPSPTRLPAASRFATDFKRGSAAPWVPTQRRDAKPDSSSWHGGQPPCDIGTPAQGEALNVSAVGPCAQLDAVSVRDRDRPLGIDVRASVRDCLWDAEPLPIGALRRYACRLFFEQESIERRIVVPEPPA